MKIIQIVSYIGNEASGPSYSVPRLCSSLKAKGCEVVLFTLAPLPKRDFPFEIRAFPRSTVPHPSIGRSPEMYKALYETIKNADIVHNHGLWMAPNIYAGIIANKLNVPFVNAPRGTLSKNALARSKWKKKIALALGQQKALNSTTCFHVTAQHEALDAKNYSQGKPLAIIPNGIDIPKQLQKTIEKKRRKVLFLGRLHPIKGIEILIKSWRDIEEQYLNWDLDIVGVGDIEYVKKLKQLIFNFSLKRVNILDPVYGVKKNETYQSADLYVLPSFSENFGMTVAEALANRTPVITTTATPWKRLNEKKCGWCIAPDEKALTRTLRNAMNLTTEQLLQIGTNGRKWMTEEYSWNRVADDMLETYEWILNRRKKPNFVIL